MKNVFSENDVQEIIERINMLNPSTERLWGKMTVSQMLAHCNVNYEIVYEPGKHPKPRGLMKWMINLMAKSTVVGNTPYKKNLQTAPFFIIKEEKDFETEKARLIHYIKQTQELGENYFDGKESHTFGVLNKTEWNNLFYKHLDHHLRQFGV
jgi:hypothetical protein